MKMHVLAVFFATTGDWAYAPESASPRTRGLPIKPVKLKRTNWRLEKCIND